MINIAKKTKVEIEFDAVTKEFNSNIKASEKHMTSLRKELKLNATELKGDAENVELLSKRKQLLAEQSIESKNKIENLNNKLNEAKRLFGDDAEQVRLLSNQITDAKTQFAAIQNEIKDTDKKLDSLNDETKEYGKELDSATKKTEKAKGGFTVLKGVIANLASQAISKAIDGLKKLNDSVKESASIGDEVDKMSQKLGMSRKGYQEWSYVLSQSGMEISSLQAGMKKLSNNIDDAINGSDSAKKMFSQLGISVDDLKNKSAEDIFSLVVSGMQGMEDTATRTALANDLLGRSGQSLIPLFNETAKSTEELKNKANELGMVMSDEAVDASVEYTDAMDTLETASSKLKSQLVAGVLPAITDIITEVTENVDMDEVGDKIENVSTKIQDGIGKLTDAYDWTTKHKALLIGIGGVIGTLAVGIGIYNASIALGTALKAADVTSIGALVAAKWTENTANWALSSSNWALAASGMAALGPILLIAAGIAALIAVIVLIVKNFDTLKAKVKEVTESMSERFNAWKEKTISSIKAIPESIGNFFEGIKNKIKVPKIEVTYTNEGTLAKVAQALGLEGFPKLSIHWNKYGYFKEKTIVAEGYAEAGDSEYALPLNSQTLDPLAAGVVNHMDINNDEVIEYVKALYSKMLELPSDFESGFIDAVANRLKINLDQRELGRVVRSY